MNFLGFTKQERIVILFLVCCLLIGGAFKLYQIKSENPIEKHYALFKNRDEQIRKFKARSKFDSTSTQMFQTDSLKNSIAATHQTKSEKKGHTEQYNRDLKININTASIKELVQLPAIGPVKANKIIEYREKVGQFKHIQEIIAVKGIGQKTFEKIAPFITIE